MWFNKKDLQRQSIIVINDLNGYVLPHAGTLHTGHIISHTLRFRPKKKIKKIIILYYPSSSTPDVQTYYHEYYVPWKSLQYIFNDDTIEYVGININYHLNLDVDFENTLIVVSADFSHFLPFGEAMNLENKAAHALMFKNLKSSPYIDIVDHVKTFKLLYKLLSGKYNLQWIGRSRSLGEQGVGYLSFLIRAKTNPHLPDGIFVTAYDKNMNTRECLGEWFTKYKKWNLFIENNLVEKVLHYAKTTSRLTGGKNKNVPILYYTITYLYKDTQNAFIRGYHGILYHAFYLPDVFLENTFNNGNWFTSKDTKWQPGTSFNLKKTFQKLNNKAGVSNSNFITKSFTLYSSKVSHFTI